MGANAHGLLGIYSRIYKPGNAIIEIGCGSLSTPVLYEIAQNAKQTFYACDNQHSEITDIGQGNKDFVYISQPGEEFLAKHFEQTGESISAAYLDNFDWMYEPEKYRTENKPDFLVQMVKEYRDVGLELNNVNSAKVHLQQSILIDKYSADQSVILFDDTWFDYAHEVYLGKGSSAIIYLLSRGWKVVQDISPQVHAVLLTKGIDESPWKLHSGRGIKNINRNLETTPRYAEFYSEPGFSTDSIVKEPEMIPLIDENEVRPRRLIVTASIGRSWNPHGEASARHWADRVGAEFYIRNEPYVIDGQARHPWFIKWDILADAVEARQPDEVVWLDDDIVVRADTGWPHYEEWAAFEVAAGHDLGDTDHKKGAMEASRITGIPWNWGDGYYNSGLVFRRNPSVAEFRELGVLSRHIPRHLMASQAALAVHLARRTGVRRLPLIWHVRGPTAPDGYLPGYINHFLGGKWDNMNRLGPLWTKVPKAAFSEVAAPDLGAWRHGVTQSVQMAIDAINADDPILAKAILVAVQDHLHVFSDTNSD